MARPKNIVNSGEVAVEESIYGGPAKADRRDLGVFKLSSVIDYWEGEE
jgi:hypothetical protein